MVLAVGHAAVVVFTFLVPWFLSRWLTIEAYGTYKQLMVIYLLAMAVTHFGMDNGLFYFIKSHPGKEAIFSLNAMLFAGLMAVLVASALALARDPLAHSFNNPELAGYLPYFCLFLALSVPTQHFEHYLTVIDDIKGALYLTVLYEAAKSAVIVAGFYFTGSLRIVLGGLAALAAFRFLCLLAFNIRRLPPGAAEEMGRHLRAQLRFSVPQGGANLIATAMKLDKVIISALFPVRQFTLYAVGCFELPLIGSVSNTLTDLMSFGMVDARRRGENTYASLWHSTMRKVALLQIPIVTFFVFFAEETIVFIFSETYRESARYFRVFVLTLLVSAFSAEILFRVFARTKLLLGLQLGAALYTLGLVLSLAYSHGPMGALVGKLIADLVSFALYSRFAAGFLELSAKEYLPWKALAGIALVSVVVATLVATLSHALFTKPLFLLAFGFAAYGALVFLLCLVTGLIKEDETRYLKDKATSLVINLRGRKTSSR